MAKAKVYFIREITPQNVVKIYESLGIKLPGKVAVKVHSGEEGNQNYLGMVLLLSVILLMMGQEIQLKNMLSY